MSYSAVVRRLLVSCPGDVPVADLATVRDAIIRWNALYGSQLASAVIPIHWSSHAAAEFGQHPQRILNDQIVDLCDLGIAIFANRLGTATPNDLSGTAEEITRLHSAGRYVAVLRCVRPVDPTTLEPSQVKALSDYLQSLRDKALVLPYSTDSELVQHVDAILTRAVSREQAQTEMLIGAATAVSVGAKHAEVWPRVESDDEPYATASGRKFRRVWHLTISNVGGSPARDVSFYTEGVDSGNWFAADGSDGDSRRPIEVLAPGGELRFPIFASLATATQVQCVVEWDDERGRQRNTATLRLA